MLIGFGSDCAVYLFAYAKNERENISHSELLSLRDIAASFLNASQEQIAKALTDGAFIEVKNGDENKDRN